MKGIKIVPFLFVVLFFQIVFGRVPNLGEMQVDNPQKLNPAKGVKLKVYTKNIRAIKSLFKGKIIKEGENFLLVKYNGYIPTDSQMSKRYKEASFVVDFKEKIFLKIFTAA